MSRSSTEQGNSGGVLFIDNGAYNIKAMFLPSPDVPPVFLTLPHCVGASPSAGRGLVGDVLRQLPHYHSLLLRRPCTRRGGFLTDADLEAYIWEYILEKFSIGEERELSVVLTVPFGAPKGVARLLHSLVTERFHFASLTLLSSSFLSLIAAAAEEDSSETGRLPSGCGVVADAGFSACVVVPYIDYLPVYTSIIRVDVGGKLLTNRLKELLSFTQIHLMEDEWLVNHIKERCCFVARDPQKLLQESYGSNDQRMYIKKCEAKGKLPVLVTHPLHGMTEGSSPLIQAYYLPSVPPLQPLGGTEGEIKKLYLMGGPSNVGGEGSQRKRQREEVVPDAKSSQGSSKLESGGGSGWEEKIGGDGLEHLSMLPQVFLQQECMSIPELLFTPGNIDIPQCGLSQAIGTGIFNRGLLAELPLFHPISANPASSLLGRVVVFGGCSNFPQFSDRLQQDLRQFVGGADTARLPRILQPSYFTLHGSHGNREPVFLDEMQKRSSASPTSCSFPISAAEIQPLKGAYHLLCNPKFASQHEKVRAHSTLHLHSHSPRAGSARGGVYTAAPPSSSGGATAAKSLGAQSTASYAHPVSVEDIYEKLQKLW